MHSSISAIGKPIFDYKEHDNTERPEPRTGSRMIYHKTEKALFLLGGQNKNSRTINDFWRFDLESGTWKKLEATGENPGPRTSHSMNLIH